MSPQNENNYQAVVVKLLDNTDPQKIRESMRLLMDTYFLERIKEGQPFYGKEAEKVHSHFKVLDDALKELSVLK